MIKKEIPISDNMTAAIEALPTSDPSILKILPKPINWKLATLIAVSGFVFLILAVAVILCVVRCVKMRK
jgi:hypothetical protein